MKRIHMILFFGGLFLLSGRLQADEDTAADALCHQQLELYKTALNADPRDADAWTKVRTCVVQLKHWNEGAEFAAKVLEKDPGIWQAYLLQGISQLHLKEYTAARDALTQASQLKGDQSMPFYYLGMTYLFMHDSESAVEAGQKAVSLDETNPANYRQLAYAYLFADMRDDCEYTAKKAIELDPNDTAAYKVLAQLYQREGKAAEAEQMAEEAIHANGRTAVVHPLAPAAVAGLPGVTSPGPAGTAPRRRLPTASGEPSPEAAKSDAVGLCLSQWRRMIEAVQKGDLDGAITFFSDYADTRPKYKESFTRLGSERLQQIFSGFSADPTDCTRIIGVVICKATIEHPGDPGTMLTSETTLRFERNEDGIWRIQSF